MRTIFVILLAGTCMIAAKAQDSLAVYLTIAAKSNPAVMQNFYEYQAALQKIPQAGSLPDPQMSVGVFLSPMELIAGNQVAEIQLMQMFPWFGTLRSAKDEMSRMANARYETFRDSKLQVFFDVQKAWYEIYKIRQNKKFTEKNLAIIHTLERLALVRYKTVSTGSSGNASPAPTSASPSPVTPSSGMQGMQNSVQQQSSPGMASAGMSSTGSEVGLADLYRIQIEEGELQNNLGLLTNQEAAVTARFNGYLNRPSTSAVFVPDSLVIDTMAFRPNGIKDSMLVNNPMLGMINEEKESLAAREKMVTRMGYPMVGLGLNYSVINKSQMSTSEMNGNDMIMPMVSITLPIYRGKYRAMRKEAEIMGEAREQQYVNTANTLSAEYYEALQLFDDAGRRMTLYEHQQSLAEKSLNILIRDFSASRSSLSDILNVRRQLLDYQFRHSEAEADYCTAIAWLKRLSGI
jgi:outer membrane protein TolC